LTVFIELEHCYVGGTTGWFRFQVIFYANLHIIRRMLLQINPLAPELSA